MRRLVVALVVVAITVGLTACSGGNSSSTSSSSSSANSAAAAAPPPPASGSGAQVSTQASNTLSPRAEGTCSAFPGTGPMVPTSVSSRIKGKSPMLVFFYDPAQLTTKDERKEIEAAMKSYRGLIDVVELDVSASLPDPVTGKPNQDPVAQRTSLLAQSLGVDFTPYMVFVDRNGIITGRFRGFVDSGLIEREIVRATQ